MSNESNESVAFGFDLTSMQKANLNLIRQAGNEDFNNDMIDKSGDNNRNGYVSVEGVIALLVESFKEQQEVINKLSLRIEELERKLNEYA